MIKVYNTGITAKTSTGNIDAIITATNIRGTRVTYELSYFHNGEYKSAWLDEKEFTTTEKKTQKIGYK